MPVEIAAEVLFRFVFECAFYALGYATGWLLVPALSFGYYEVEPLSPPKRGVKRVRSRAVRDHRQLSAETATMAGILFWVAVIALVWWVTSKS